MSRRKFLQMLGMSSVAWTMGNSAQMMEAIAAAPTGEFVLLPLPYDYAALEPYIDAATMRLHHDKHHAAYIKNLNAALAKYPKLKSKSIEYLVENWVKLPQEIRTAVRNNGGGHLNHSMFWQIMGPAKGQKPTGELAAAIDKSFGSFEKFQAEFVAAGAKHFGSGWVWLVLQAGQLKIVTTANQDSPLTTGMLPVMGNDLWEHAYYLNYQNRRADYLKAWWQVVNWVEVGKRFDRFVAGNP